MSANPITGAEALLRSLKQNGIDLVFANAGSDFAPIIEACVALGKSDEVPEFIIATHENVCLSMAHGYYLATGRMQAAMVHTNVGLANATMGVLNARSDDIPIFVLSGRTPLTEHARLGSRQNPIQYGQEMFDQTSLVRDSVKYDYELRYAENAADLVSRAASVARSEPVGAVYMSLPREPLCETVDSMPDGPIQVAGSVPYPDPAAIRAAADALASAQNPLIVCSRGDPAGAVEAELIAIAEENDIAVAEVFSTRNIMPTDHDLLIGPNLVAHLPAADAVLVIDASVAWMEAKVQPAADATVIHLGPDPLFARMPVRAYRTSIAIQSNVAAGLAALRAALPGTRRPERRAAILEKHRAFLAAMDRKAADGSQGTPTKAFVARAVSDRLGDDGVVFAERAGPVATFRMAGGNRWFGNTQAGGLGWCLPAALGYQMANRDRLVVAMMGDGSYVFANPTASHQVAAANDLPVLTVVLNNGGWDAVRTSTLDVYPDGAAAKANRMPMVHFEPVPDYAAIAAASGAWSRKVDQAGDVAAALDAAIEVVRSERRQALLDITVLPD